jgi:hypothetical protein
MEAMDVAVHLYLVFGLRGISRTSLYRCSVRRAPSFRLPPDDLWWTNTKIFTLNHLETNTDIVRNFNLFLIFSLLTAKLQLDMQIAFVTLAICFPLSTAIS